MPNKKRAKRRKRKQGTLSARLDKVTELLENLFILQALTSGIGRSHIREAIGVHTTRISRINKGLKNAKEA